MAKVMDNYQLLVQKLDQFIRKYYVNQMIRGLLYSIGLIVLLFIMFNAAEYYYYFSTGVRKGLFYSFIGISSMALIGWVLMPMLKYFRLGSTLSNDQAANIIGDHGATPACTAARWMAGKLGSFAKTSWASAQMAAAFSVSPKTP